MAAIDKIELDLFKVLLNSPNVNNPTGELPEEGDVVFEKLCEYLDQKSYKTIAIDLSNLPKFTSAFLNNAIGKLFLKYDHDYLFKVIKIEGIENSFDFNLLRDTIKNAVMFSLNNR
jgi:hypothetical protein